MIYAEDPIGGAASTLLDRGVLGAIVIVLGWFAWRLIGRETARADDLQRRLDELNESLRADVLPAVIRATDAQARATEVLDRVANMLPDVASALRDVKRRG